MNKHFYETTFFQIMNIFSNIVLVSIFFIFTSLPLITVGASSAALYYTVVKVIRKDTGSICKEYFNSFISNLLQCLIPGVFFLIYGMVLVAHYYNWINGREAYGLVSGVLFFLTVALIAIASYLFPVISRFQNHFLVLLRMAVTMAVKNLKTTALLLLLYMAGFIVMWAFLSIAVLIPGILTFLASFLLEPVLKQYMPEVKKDSPEAAFWYNR